MHRFFTIILVVLLVVALSIPCFAATELSMEQFKELAINQYNVPAEVFEENTYWTVFSLDNGDIDFIEIFGHSEPGFVDGDFFTIPNQEVYYIQLWADDWSVKRPLVNHITTATYSVAYIEEMHSNYDIRDKASGEIAYPASMVTLNCNGSTCPANDLNHDNICDDCGKVLTYNLRSTLLEFAKASAESWIGTWPYYSVVSDGMNDDRYMVYMSNNPQTATKENPDVVTSPNGLNRFQVTTNSDGTFSASGNYGATEWSGTLVYANHTIENFQMPPLAAIIQGVMGETMKVEIPNLLRVMKTLVLCGVGCLALLIGLKLFGKRSLLFLRR